VKGEKKGTGRFIFEKRNSNSRALDTCLLAFDFEFVYFAIAEIAVINSC